jgi:hypothetical protein
MVRPRGFAGLLVVLSLVSSAVVTACGGDDDDAPPSTRGTSGAGGDEAVAGSAGGDGGAVDGTAGGAAGEPAWGPLELVSRTPEPDDSDVWFYEPIVLEVSNPLDEATVTTTGAFTVSIGGVPQAQTLALSADGKRVTIELKAPPVLAATAELEIGAGVRDRRGGALTPESWSYRLPLWQSPPEISDEAELPALALDAQDRPLVASIEGGEVLVRRFDGAAWVTLGGALNPGGNASSAPALVFSPKLGPVVAYGDAGTVSVASWDGQSWKALGGMLSASDEGVALALGQSGELMLALRVTSGIEVRSWDGSELAELATAAVSPGTLAGFALAVDDATPVLAYYDDTPRLILARRTGSTFSELAAPLLLAELPNGAPSLFVRDGAVYVAYVDHDELSANAFVRVRQKDASVLEPFGAALDLSFDADVSAPQIAAAGADAIAVTWNETQSGVNKLYAALWNAGRPQFLGSALQSRKSGPFALGLAVDSHGNPNVVYAADGATLVRYNGSPEAPFGLSGRASTKSCVLPATDSASFPTKLVDTGCYEDVAKHQVMDAALPYELNTALWSDGALKRRFIVLPDDATITATDTGAWTLPVGAIVIKEFWYERVAGDPSSAFPMETRFLVKRCEEDGSCVAPLEGYSYRWNEAGTEATLLTDAEAPPSTGLIVKWPVTSGGDPEDAGNHSHTYPSRAQCVRCHNASVGRYLGLQTPQLNRPAAFPQAVDNQLRTFEAIGVFSKPLSAGGADSKARLPSANDPAFTLQERALAYFHANCAHCHNPQGERPAIDFRYYGGAGLTADNICSELNPGSSGNSPIYVRDSSRPGGMPPIATLVPDTRQLPVTAAWIDALTACPGP